MIVLRIPNGRFPSVSESVDRDREFDTVELGSEHVQIIFSTIFHILLTACQILCMFLCFIVETHLCLCSMVSASWNDFICTFDEVSHQFMRNKMWNYCCNMSWPKFIFVHTGQSVETHHNVWVLSKSVNPALFQHVTFRMDPRMSIFRVSRCACSFLTPWENRDRFLTRLGGLCTPWG